VRIRFASTACCATSPIIRCTCTLR
jgi:hypothetical protein